MKHDELYMSIAEMVANKSRCKRSKVGAVVVKNGNIIAFGWNGMPAGYDNECECAGVTRPEVVHAEANALMKCAKSTESTEGATMYITHSPCWECSKLILSAGISRVVYRHKYRVLESLALLDGVAEWMQ